jgi:biotin carboxyl carrier protein
LKLRLDVDGQNYSLDWKSGNGPSEYTLSGDDTVAGTASVLEVMPGVFSILLGARSFTVHLAPNGDGTETFTAGQHHHISIFDPRDRADRRNQAGHTGPVELRSQMPGKIIKILVELGAAVEAGQGLVVVEAMKMQNELKAPKAGTVSKINAVEGATVAAGESLVIVE